MAARGNQQRDNVPAARELRTRQTAAEEMVWGALRGRRLAGLKFRRQHPIGTFVVDFCCPDRRLVVELDGAVHATQQEHDAEREALLVAAGYRALRFPNESVNDDLPAVLETIRAAAAEQPSIPALRSPRSGTL
jgi:very-short-patch-repair endonuclease